MKEQTRHYGFREDAITWIKDHGFYYVNYYGWCHAGGFTALVEYTGRRPARPWVLTIYKSSVPKPQEVS